MAKAKQAVDQEVGGAEVVDPDAALDPKPATVPAVLVTIRRSEHTTIVKPFAEFEVPVLEGVHGEDSIVVGDSTDPVELITSSADEEYARYSKKYETRNTPNAFTGVYPTVASFAEAAGLDYSPSVGKRRVKAVPANSEIDHSKK